MKQKGDFQKFKERNKKRQELFDRIKECRHSKTEFFMNIGTIRYRVWPTSLDVKNDDTIQRPKPSIYDYSDYLVFHDNKFKIAHNHGTNRYWSIDTDSGQYRMTAAWLLKNAFGRIVEEFNEQQISNC